MKALNDPLERKRILHLNLVILVIFVAFPVAGYFYSGLDFMKATLIGCGVVAFNFFSSQFLLAKVVLESRAVFRLIVWYLIKFALSVAVLFVAVVQWQVDLVGLMIGLSSVVISTVISSLMRGEVPQQEDE